MYGQQQHMYTDLTVTAQCDNFEIENALVPSRVTIDQIVVTVTCLKPYVLIGGNKATCQFDGTWITKPTCGRDCSVSTSLY